MKQIYDESTEAHMITFFENLSEKDRRHYAAVEALKLGHGGISYISDLFGISIRTIERGLDELKKKISPDQYDPFSGRRTAKDGGN
jgi:hypothetical protein